MKKILFGLLMLSAMSFSWGKGVSDTSTAAGTSKKIGILVPTLQSEFFVSVVDGVKKGMGEHGYDVLAEGYNNDSNKAISIVENYTISNVDCIIAMVTDKSADSALQAAMDKGIKVVVPGVETGAYDLCILADNKDVGKKIGEMGADFVNTKLNGKADAVAFVSTTSSDMADRSTMMIQTLEKLAPGVKIVGKSEYKNVGDGAAAIENYLQQDPNIKLIVSFGDQAGLEALEAVKAAGKSTATFGIFGCDATQQGLKAIANGSSFRGTVSMGNIVNDMVSYTTRLLNKDPALQKRIVGENIKITAANIQQYLK